MENVIFDFTRTDWKYKGVFTAFADIAECDKILGFPANDASSFLIEVWGIIWTDENNEWHAKLRFKFPSGTKEVGSKSYGKDCNETKILTDLYKFPMRDKFWFKNPSQTGEGIYEIMVREDLILSERVVKHDE